MTTTIVCAVLGIIIGTFIILLINFFTTSHTKKEKDTSKKEEDYLEVSQSVKLTPAAKRAVQTIASSGGDLVNVPGSLIGRFVEVKNLINKTSVSGIALAEYIYSPINPQSDGIFVRINILSLQGLENVDIPINESGKSFQVNFRTFGDTVRPGKMDAVQDIISFCEKQCIFDCSNCILSKYGIRKTRKSES